MPVRLCIQSVLLHQIIHVYGNMARSALSVDPVQKPLVNQYVSLSHLRIYGITPRTRPRFQSRLLPQICENYRKLQEMIFQKRKPLERIPPAT